MKFSAIIVAAGEGSRFGGPKQFVMAAGKTLLEHALEPFVGAVDQIIVVMSPAVLPDINRYISNPDLLETLDLVEGGDSRSESVRKGLAALDESCEVVLIHDGARPLVSVEVIERVKASVVSGASAVVPVTPLSETLYSVEAEALDRSQYRLAQTPQGFRKQVLKEAHSGPHTATDDATLAIEAGYEVSLVDGDIENRKVTFPFDIAAIEYCLNRRQG